MALVKDWHYTEEKICGWDQLLGFEKRHRSNPDAKDKETEWIFRGQKDNSWGLRTTLEEAIVNFGIDTKQLRGKCKDEEEFRAERDKKLTELLKGGLNGHSIHDIEAGLIRKFQRQYHHHALTSPGRKDITEWLALMRHHGAPVRLHDWTYSFYVAVFFAIEDAEGDCAVWALEKKSIINKVLGRSGDDSVLAWDQRDCLSKDVAVIDSRTWETVFNRNPAPFVFPVNSFRLSERAVIQQSDFLCPGNISQPFEENLAAVLPAEVKNDFDYKLLKYVINAKEKREILLNLHRMNINRATLFPGLDGFARSLKTLLASPEHLLKP